MIAIFLSGREKHSIGFSPNALMRFSHRATETPGKSCFCGREKKCSAGFQPAKVLLTQKELSRLRCRRDAGATIFSHDLWLRG